MAYNDKLNLRKLIAVMSIAAAGITLNVLYINLDKPIQATGLKPITPEENAKLNRFKVKKVGLNEIGLKRINEERRKRGMPELSKDLLSRDEVVDSTFESSSTTGASGADSLASGSTSTASLSSTSPSFVDNSQLSAFPPIGNQGSLPSCVAWAVTYYQMSHQICLSTGCDNKARAGIRSPRWTYNFINGGQAQGTYFSDAFAVQERNGAALETEFPYSSDYRAWSTDSLVWKSAINYRTSTASSLQINTDSAMANVKLSLLNGNVLVIGTYINSWNLTTVKSRPDGISSPFAGQRIVTHQNGTAGAHAMTVVGFDDTIWADHNANGTIDNGELGAFKIANSWGTGYGNAGFMWVSYDAFRTTSTIAGFAPSGRNQLTQNGYSYLVTYKPYAPKLLAKVTASHAARAQANIQFGASSTSTTSPQAYFQPKAHSQVGGAYAYNGSTTEIESTFYFDISNIATASNVNDQLYYLLLNDNSSGSPFTVKAFQIVDPLTDATLHAASGVPLIIDAAAGRLIAGNYTPDLQAPTAPSSLTASLSSQRKGKRVTTAVDLKWQASTDNVSVAKYLVYRNGVKIAETTSLSYRDSSGSAGVSYTYEIAATDSSGNVSAKSNSVTIAR